MAAKRGAPQPERAATRAADQGAAAAAEAAPEQRRPVVRVPGGAAAALQARVPAARVAAVLRVAAAWRVRAPPATPELSARWEAWVARVLEAVDGEGRVVAGRAGAQEPAE
jgi:hypothetical protein